MGDSWNNSRLGGLTTVSYGKSPKGIFEKNGAYNVLGTGGVVGKTNRYLTDSPSIILGRKGTIKNVQLSHYPMWSIDTTFFLEPKNIDTKYLYYFLCQINIERLNEATGVPSLSRQNIESITVEYPEDKKEQQKIANILSTVDKKIDLIEQKIQLTHRLKKGLMQKLFSEGVGTQDANGNWIPHQEFVDSPLGKIPKGWNIKPIKALGRVVTGGTPSTKNPSYYGDKCMFVSPGDMHGERKIKSTAKMLSEEGMKFSKIIPENSTLFTCIGSTIGKVAMAPEELATNQQINSIVPDVNVVPEFLYYSTVCRIDHIRMLAGKQAVPIVKKSLFESVLILVPELIEQRKIASFISMVDDKIELLDKQKSQTQQLKKGLMQKLLTGEWRVAS